MKRVKKILIFISLILIFVSFIPINFSYADTSYVEKYNYHTTVKLVGYIEENDDTYTLKSKEILGDTNSTKVKDTISIYQDKFTNYVNEIGEFDITFETNNKVNRTETDNVISNTKDGTTITTIYEVYQTLTIEANASFKNVIYSVLIGDNQEYIKNSISPLTFKFDIPEEKINDNLEVLIDDNILDKTFYTFSKDSILTINNEYINDLELKTYNLKVNVDYGESNTTFKLVKKSFNFIYIFFGLALVILLICYLIIRKYRKK